MNFDHTPRVKALIDRLEQFMADNICPAEREYHDWVTNPDNLWQHWPGLDHLKAKAKAEGLWNLFLPKEYGELSPGLTNLEYAPLAEIMGRVPWSPEVFNCSAPDTGNMEVLAKYGTPEQQRQRLRPLLDGEIRSAYLMTEPQVASSDATNVETEIRADGDTATTTSSTAANGGSPGSWIPAVGCSFSWARPTPRRRATSSSPPSSSRVTPRA